MSSNLGDWALCLYFVQLRIAKVKTTFCLCENSTSEDKASYQEDLATAKEQLGGEDAYAKYLREHVHLQQGL